MPRPDFVFVQLTPQGEAQAGGHPMRVTGRTSIVFTPGVPTQVARYEWDLMLDNYVTSHGLPIFELVPAPAAQPASATPAVPATASPGPSATKETK